MGVAEWTGTYGIHHWRILWSSYRRLTWMGLEPRNTEFPSDALTNLAIKPWVQLALRANVLQLLQFRRLFSVKFHFGHCYVSRRVCFLIELYIFAKFMQQCPKLIKLPYLKREKKCFKILSINYYYVEFSKNGVINVVLGFFMRSSSWRLPD